MEVDTRTGKPLGGGRPQAGFSLLEMMVVLTIIAILASIAVPMYQSMILRTKEAVLKENLHSLRATIDAFTADKKSAPQSLQDLITAGYMREIPEDPITESNQTWTIEYGDAMVPDQLETGIVDVHSGSTAVASDGTQYNDW